MSEQHREDELLAEIDSLRRELNLLRPLEQVNQTLQIEVERTRRFQQDMIDSFPDYIYAKNRESRFFMVNTTVGKLMGVDDPQQLIGKTDFDFFPQDIAQHYFDDEQMVMRTGLAVVNREEHTLDQRTNTLGWILTTKVPLKDTNGSVIGVLGIGRDITEIKTAQEALERAKRDAEAANRAKSAFLANMTVELDRARKGQVLNNLLSNAVKYTPEGGRVELSGKVDSNMMLIQVIDTGLGIPADDLPHLFEKFYRVKREEHMKSEGTGLGLAIVKAIVEGHGGEIWVESEPGMGSCFNIHLPLAES